MSKIQAAFDRLQMQGRKALIPLIVAGVPDVGTTVSLMHTLVEAGADIIELGIPVDAVSHAAPLLPGESSLNSDECARQAFGMVASFRADNNETPVVLRGSTVPGAVADIERLAAIAFDAGVDGMMFSGFPQAESEHFSRALRTCALDPVFEVASAFVPEYIEALAGLASGFIHYVPVRNPADSPALAMQAIEAHLPVIRAAIGLPVVAGFGIRNAVTAAAIARLADGIVPDSILMEEIRLSPPETLLARVRTLVADLRHVMDIMN